MAEETIAERCTVCDELALFACAECEREFYCSEACQQKDWPSHSTSCREKNADLGGFIALENLLAQSKPRTLIVSPSSLLSALGVTSIIMDDVAKHDIARMFAGPEENTIAASAAAAVVNSSNSIWFVGRTIVPVTAVPFIKIATEIYRATVEFAPTAQRINNWVFEKTYGKIRQIVTENDISTNGLLIVNALVFECKWKTPFEKSISVEGAQFGFDKHCCMMHNTSANVYGYISKDGFGCVLDLVLPTTNLATKYRLSVVLAMRHDGKMPNESFVRRVASSTQMLSDVYLGVPVTYVSFGPQDIKSLLLLKEALQPGHVLFDKSLIISHIIHCAKFKFDELGAEGAAATSVGMKCSAVSGSQRTKRKMIFEKPFFAGVAVYERKNPLPITFPFASFIVDPSKDKF